MGKVIWKYPLAVTDEQEVEMPVGAAQRLRCAHRPHLGARIPSRHGGIYAGRRRAVVHSEGIMIDFILGALTGCAATGLVAGCIAEYERRHAPRPEPQRVTPEDVKPLTDALSTLSRTLRASPPLLSELASSDGAEQLSRYRAYGADEVTAAAHHALNLERKARGLPPFAGPELRETAVYTNVKSTVGTSNIPLYRFDVSDEEPLPRGFTPTVQSSGWVEMESSARQSVKQTDKDS